MGKIGVAISPQNPDVVYAAIELDRRQGAVYRSADRGASWETPGLCEDRHAGPGGRSAPREPSGGLRATSSGRPRLPRR
jgi:hypothetical protein